MLISFWLVCIKLAENVVISSMCEISFQVATQRCLRSLEILREKSRKLFITSSLVFTAPVTYLYCAQSCQTKQKKMKISVLGIGPSVSSHTSRWGDAIAWFRIRWASICLKSIYSHSCINVYIHRYTNWKLSKATLICWILMLITPALLMLRNWSLIYVFVMFIMYEVTFDSSC